MADDSFVVSAASTPDAFMGYQVDLRSREQLRILAQACLEGMIQSQGQGQGHADYGGLRAVAAEGGSGGGLGDGDEVVRRGGGGLDEEEARLQAVFAGARFRSEHACPSQALGALCSC